MTDPRSRRPDQDGTAGPERPGGVPAEGDDLGPDANELDADNAVEADMIETVDPENPPA
jgi:hypothetical protein